MDPGLLEGLQSREETLLPPQLARPLLLACGSPSGLCPDVPLWAADCVSSCNHAGSGPTCVASFPPTAHTVDATGLHTSRETGWAVIVTLAAPCYSLIGTFVSKTQGTRHWTEEGSSELLDVALDGGCRELLAAVMGTPGTDSGACDPAAPGGALGAPGQRHPNTSESGSPARPQLVSSLWLQTWLLPPS